MPRLPAIETAQIPFGQGVLKTIFIVNGRRFDERDKAVAYRRSFGPAPAPKAAPATPATSDRIKALVVRSPAAQQIASGEKRIEYRSWPTHHRGCLAIIAARRPESGKDAGRIVCLVRLVDCRENGGGEYNWMLADPIPLTERIEIPGRLGLFDVTDRIPAQVRKMLGK